LQPLLDRKVEKKDEAERELVSWRQKLRMSENALDETRERQRALEAERTERRNGLLTGVAGGLELRRRVGDLELVGRRIEEAKDEAMSLLLEIEERKEQVELAVAEVAAATRELEVLKKHKEKTERRFRAECDRKEAGTQDEIASVLFEARRRL
jgi:flagellar biosynthesis chaperone FliJ